MILYRLICSEGHEFESWFRDSEAYDRQAAQGAVSCPFCHSTKVAKAIMAPHVARRSARAREEGTGVPALHDERHAALRTMIRELRQKIAASTEDVGDRLPEEARRIQDGEAEMRAIRGRASFEEAKALLEDGIEILPIPGPPDESH
ncbi:DUF1178 family protein [Methylosinus sporium]|uniref:DUF1178 family protein n=1 Tax=Methylosinus sporium TaxID=428 RepID=A0A549T361_METSR|nr:DUF1178 family protein [Methylosinus sporium]MBU3887154.1 DUF1178 family protein [Methylosinus sp. KRF6]TRL36301.1 DUF1178 family protein [Methylosinus sporium]